MATFTETWNAAFEASPADSDAISAGAGKIRSHKVAISERIKIDHSLAGDGDDGEHTQVTFTAPISTPATLDASKGILYTKDVTAKAELHYLDEDDNEIQLTDAGAVAGLVTPLDSYPVGAIYMSVVSTTPATLFGGTWVALAAGKVLVGIDAGDSDFDTVEETGGAKTHTLAVSEMPAHTHTSAYSAMEANSAGASDWAGNQSTGPFPNSGSSGGGGAHNNVQPYLVVYMWKRTV